MLGRSLSSVIHTLMGSVKILVSVCHEDGTSDYVSMDVAGDDVKWKDRSRYEARLDLPREEEIADRVLWEEDIADREEVRRWNYDRMGADASSCVMLEKRNN